MSIKNSISEMSISKNDIATSIHDIKNLITIISLTAELMDKERNDDKNDLARIKYASKMATNILLYTLSSMKSEKISIETVDINEIIDDVKDIIQIEFEINKIKINIKNNLKNSVVMANKLFLTRAILNLLLNSRAAVPKNGGEIAILLDNTDDEVRIMITDNGPGFPDEILNKIEAFKSTRLKSGGTGLGLFSTYEIIKGLNGSFKIYNKNGAVSEIILPVAK
jgi:signal transduction histidine kinase